jgi:hypothetical protein
VALIFACLVPLVFCGVVLVVPLVCGLPLARLLALGKGSGDRSGLAGLGGLAGLVATWLIGVVVSSVLAVLASMVGLGWSRAVLPVLVAAVVLERLVARHVRERELEHRVLEPRAPVAVPPWSSGLLGLVWLVAVAVGFALAASAATSADLAFFWCPKALGLARADGIDWAWLREPFLVHLHVTYPPAWTALLAWGGEAVGQVPWRVVPWLSLAGLLAAVPLVRALLADRLGSDADPVAGLWLVALGTGLVSSLSGGNAAALLLLLETTAVAALITGPPTGRDGCSGGASSSRWLLAALCLAGAVLTKSEGAVAVVLVVGGVALRGLLRRERGLLRRLAVLAAPAVGVYLLWLGARLAHGLPLADPIREPVLDIGLDQLPVIVKVGLRSLGMGTAGLSWIVPALLVAVPALGVTRRRLVAGLVEILPALALVIGLPAFAALYYLHVRGDVGTMITWTLPRLALPALSAWILGTCVLSGELRQSVQA